MSRQANIVDFEKARSASRSVRSTNRSSTISGSARKPPAPLSQDRTSAPRPRVAKSTSESVPRHRRTTSVAKSTTSKSSVKADSTQATAAKTHTKSKARSDATSSHTSKRGSTSKSASSNVARSASSSSTRTKRSDTDVQTDRSSVREKMEKRRHDMRKKRADRTFDRSVKQSSTSSSDGDTAPRAALYQTKMGSSHKRSARMQNERISAVSLSIPGFSSIIGKLVGRSRRFYITCTVTACIVFSAAFLFPAVQNYYSAVRNQQKAQAEYAAIESRNAMLANDISDLSTQAGIEDRAREQYGWVKQGENAVRVTGLSSTSDSTLNTTGLMTVGTVSAPDVWYSGILDKVFGYQE